MKINLFIALLCITAQVPTGIFSATHQSPSTSIVALAQHRLQACNYLQPGLPVSEETRNRLLKDTARKMRKRIALYSLTTKSIPNNSRDHDLNIREFAELCGILPRKSGGVNPVHLKDIAENIIRFLGVPPLNGIALPSEDGYDGDTHWTSDLHGTLQIATMPTNIAWGKVKIHDGTTGKLLQIFEGENLQALGGIQPTITITTSPHPESSSKTPYHNVAVSIESAYDRSTTLINFYKLSTGSLIPARRFKSWVLHNPAKAENMSVPQAVSLYTMHSLATRNTTEPRIECNDRAFSRSLDSPAIAKELLPFLTSSLPACADTPPTAQVKRQNKRKRTNRVFRKKQLTF